jgi:hypothetical protein
MKGDVIDGNFNNVVDLLRTRGIDMSREECIDAFDQIQTEVINVVNSVPEGHKALVRAKLV